MTRIALLLAAMAISGCVSTTITTPEGLTITRTAVYSDFSIKAQRAADGSMSVDETQEGGQQAAQALLDLIRKAAP